MTAPLVWSLGDAAAVKSPDGWIVEAVIDLEHLRAQPTGPRLDLRVQRIEHARAQTHRPKWSPFPGRVILPVCAWKLAIDGVRAWELDIAENEVELMVKEVAGGVSELRIEGVVGRLSLRGRGLRAEAQFLGVTDLEAVRFLGFEYFRTRSDRAQGAASTQRSSSGRTSSR